METTALTAAFLTQPWVVKVAAMLVVYLFLPLSALTYYCFRRHRGERRVAHILSTLQIDENYRRIYSARNSGRFLAMSVGYCSLVSLGCLSVLFLAVELGLKEMTFVEFGTGQDAVSFPADNSFVILGMAFLGAYLWGMQYVVRRYLLDDLTPGVYFTLSMRMLMAGAVAVVIYNGYEALSGSGEPSGGIGSAVWPALAFLLGMFPQRGISWLSDRLTFFSPEGNPAVRRAPVDMIEGVSAYDRLRLEECGIDDCYDLAMADFVPLALSTPYSARALVDWILQAKLCIYAPGSLHDLRMAGFRTIVDLERLDDEQMRTLAQETSVTYSVLEQARRSLHDNAEVSRLRKISYLLGTFTPIDESTMRAAQASELTQPQPLARKSRSTRGR